ncbi:hypothetical protein K493DRAFT_305759 [Basidiobolus meristosporus CBS 931.73]|uniref:Peroxisomal membrane protein PEX14 n=1 Tax=Basidiobolus meristosporus CBS 931.73 TaxID=1314790 RepID=A0A1Y1XUK3_9FUNG|nr:hypothetical protein K493DRAFT_305759 [Basidiobolus meristosporus CBS 931.73]|eukprot:ORX89442.1 hypothetical protein K493DRAFT_305759 [Basidiobolus meristosporus CBS 931.73]
MSERMQLVESAVKFLQLPEVQSRNPHQKIEFLRSKGLSNEEIKEAIACTGQIEPVARDFEMDSTGSMQAAEENRAWESAKQMPQNTQVQTSLGMAHEGKHWYDVLAFSKPELGQWKSYLAVTAGTLGSVYGIYGLIKSFSSKKGDSSQGDSLTDTDAKPSLKKPTGLKLNGTSFSLHPPSAEEQLTNLTLTTVALQGYVEKLRVSITNLQKQAATRDQEFKLLGAQLDELQHSIPQVRGDKHGTSSSN